MAKKKAAKKADLPGAGDRVWCTSLPPKFSKAVAEKAARLGITGDRMKAQVIRLALALWVGDESLADVPMGRPKKSDDA